MPKYSVLEMILVENLDFNKLYRLSKQIETKINILLGLK
ncbi:hypothetical protein [Flagellimonas aequoris]